MNALDFGVLIAAQIAILALGFWSLRRKNSQESYLRNQNQPWYAVGIGIMATQASAITFLSAPGLAYSQGVGFVQFYLGMPIALWIIGKWGLPWYYKLNVITAYEYLEHRYDQRIRRLASLLFLAHRGIAAGLTIYAPALVFHYALGWNLAFSIVAIGLLVMVTTVSGGARAVAVTQQGQMALIFVGMAYAAYSLIQLKPIDSSWETWLLPAKSIGRMEWLDFSWDLRTPYTVWSGILAGTFLMLSYFGTDQSQVQRYLGGTDLRQSRLGLRFNSWLKIPMQAGILFLGVLLYAHYSRVPTPVHFNRALVEDVLTSATPAEQRFYAQKAETHRVISQQRADLLRALDRGALNPTEQKSALLRIDKELSENRAELQKWIKEKTGDGGDTNLIFLHYVLHAFPHGFLGLLLAVLLAASMSSTSAELSALAASTWWDWRPARKEANETVAFQDLTPARVKWITFAWGLYAIGFALIAHRLGSLLEAVNAIGSLVYGAVLGIFVAAWFVPRLGGRALFWAVLATEFGVISLWSTQDWPFLWYNPLGCLGVLGFAAILQGWVFRKSVAPKAEEPIG